MPAHDRVAEGGGHACGTPPPPPPAQVACSAQCWTCQRGDTHYRTEDRRRHVSTSIDHTSIAGADVALQQLWSICTGTWSNWQVHAKNLPRGEVGPGSSCPQRSSTYQSKLLSWTKNATSPPDTATQLPFQWVRLRRETRIGQGSDRQGFASEAGNGWFRCYWAP